MVALTERAQAVVQRLVSEAAVGTTGLRIVVDQGGCSGLQYLLGLETSASANDHVYAFGDVKVYVDPDSRPMIDGMNVDFVESLEASGFVFDNPNARDVCSCGKSFSS